MSTDLAVSMDELERESAELLPGRETLCVYSHPHAGFSFTQVASNQQAGLININILGGDIINL